jgi:hypothetical protein
LPSFTSKEKHYSVDLIGKALEGILLRGVCIRYAQELMWINGDVYDFMLFFESFNFLPIKA